MKLEIAVLAGADSKAFLVNLTKVVERMEKAAGIKPAKASAAIDDDDDIETDDVEEDDEDLAPKKTAKGKKAKPVEDDDDEVVDDSEDEDEDLAPKKTTKGKKAKAAVDEDDEEELVDDSEDEDEDLKPKAKKAKKYSLDDVKDACKAYAKNYVKENECSAKEGVDHVKKILKKNFGTISTSEIEETDFAKAIKLLAV